MNAHRLWWINAFFSGIILMFQGISFMILWGWGVVPLFSFPVLSLMEALGIILLIRLANNRSLKQFHDKEDGAQMAYLSLQKLGSYGLFLVAGYVLFH